MELANNRIATLEAEATNATKRKETPRQKSARRNTRMFEVKDEGGTDGTLTVAPGHVDVRAEESKRQETHDDSMSQIKRIEAGKSAFQPPHVNIYVTVTADLGDGRKERRRDIFTSSGGHGLIRQNTLVDITSNVIDGVINACKMVRINQ